MFIFFSLFLDNFIKLLLNSNNNNTSTQKTFVCSFYMIQRFWVGEKQKTQKLFNLYFRSNFYKNVNNYN